MRQLKGSCLLWREDEKEAALLLKCTKTQRGRGTLMKEEITRCKILRGNKATWNIGAFACKINVNGKTSQRK
jgi:hypothetical protein